MRNFEVGLKQMQNGQSLFFLFMFLSADVSPKISRKVMKNWSSKNLAMHWFKIVNENANKKNPVDLKDVD